MYQKYIICIKYKSTGYYQTVKKYSKCTHKYYATFPSILLPSSKLFFFPILSCHHHPLNNPSQKPDPSLLFHQPHLPSPKLLSTPQASVYLWDPAVFLWPMPQRSLGEKQQLQTTVSITSFFKGHDPHGFQGMVLKINVTMLLPCFKLA